MLYLEDENIDLLMGNPLETDALFMMSDEEKEESRGKDPAREEDPVEESDPESAEGAEEAPVAAEDAKEVSEAKVDKPSVAKEDAPVEEAPAKDEAKVEESAAEGAKEVSETKVDEPNPEPIEGEPTKPEMDPEETAYVAQQTKLVQATYLDMRKNLPKFRSGDKVSVGYRVIEGDRSRIQNFDGVVIKISAGHGMDKTFTVRKVSSGIGVERIFPFHSPNIDSIKVLKQGKIRRAKLYYLRNRVGKSTRIKERTSQ